MLLLLILCHALGTAFIQNFDLLVHGPELLVRSVRLATLQQEQGIAMESGLRQTTLDTGFRILAAIQIALLVFTFRTRIRRY